MKLYRGLRTDVFQAFDSELQARATEFWRDILQDRQRAKDYPEHLNQKIVRLHKDARLQKQAFSDSRQIATRYIAGHRGGLLEIDVSLAEILQHFELEIQNYAQRRQHFEIVYTVQAEVLQHFMQNWHLQISHNSENI